MAAFNLHSQRFRCGDGAAYGRRIGFALETQYAPDSVNQPGFEPCILHAGETWGSVTEYRFE